MTAASRAGSAPQKFAAQGSGAHESGERTGGVLVAGVGNMFLHDDGFGPEVARHLAAHPQPLDPGVRVVDYGIRGMHLAYDLLAGVDILVLVDTVPPDANSAPGSIRVLQVSAADLDGRAVLDPHGMDPAAVLGRLRSMGGSLPATYVVGCVPADLSEGIGLSPAVAAAVPEAAAAVGSLLGQQTSTPSSSTAS
ncbi:hydrogenase maturation protease [Arthrobacter globiformis]|uniref:hydrogenase maturation protease n=1 Tax=Arthrobacter globiformis TaxID=1665 RepID=UPI00277DC7BE|nr:hydrogenase maturation protease [Arthrobacter globiformis]MDQ0863361.1 hydrogenase maturation protease [Arthrobacter globiformis]